MLSNVISLQQTDHAPTEVVFHVPLRVPYFLWHVLVHRSSTHPDLSISIRASLLHSALVQVQAFRDNKNPDCHMAHREQLMRNGVFLVSFLGSSMLPLSRLDDGRNC